MEWTRTTVALDGTHHVLEGRPLYEDRFDEALSFHAPGLAAVRRGGAAWHIDAAGRAAYARSFVRTFGFYDERAAVADADGWTHVDPRGEPAYEARYAWCGNFQEGLCVVRDRDGSYLHVDRSGAAATERRWRYAGDFRGGAAVVQGDDARCTHVDAAGRLVHGRWFIDLDVFHKGFARARDADGWMHVDRAGRGAYARRFAMVEPFYNGQARVETPEGRREIIDEEGRTVLGLPPSVR